MTVISRNRTDWIIPVGQTDFRATKNKPALVDEVMTEQLVKDMKFEVDENENFVDTKESGSSRDDSYGNIINC